MNHTYLTTEQLAERIHFQPGTLVLATVSLSKGSDCL